MSLGKQLSAELGMIHNRQEELGMAYIVGSTEVNQNEQWSPNQNQNLHSETPVTALSVVKAGKIMGQNVVAPG